MAQTMNYLSENNLLEYAVLEEKTTAATAHHNDLSAQIKAAETVSYTHLHSQSRVMTLSVTT